MTDARTDGRTVESSAVFCLSRIRKKADLDRGGSGRGGQPLNTRLLASLLDNVDLVDSLPGIIVESPLLLVAIASNCVRKLNSLPVIRRLSTLNFWIKACAILSILCFIKIELLNVSWKAEMSNVSPCTPSVSSCCPPPPPSTGELPGCRWGWPSPPPSPSPPPPPPQWCSPPCFREPADALAGQVSGNQEAKKDQDQDQDYDFYKPAVRPWCRDQTKHRLFRRTHPLVLHLFIWPLW